VELGDDHVLVIAGIAEERGPLTVALRVEAGLVAYRRRRRSGDLLDEERGPSSVDGGVVSAVPYQRIAELTFEEMDALQAGLGSEQGRAAVNDIPNFATGGVTIFFAEID
jgi:hypothetical protein